ncbi:defective proboscis extension response 7 [Carabus blaptoides fortunei]
MCSGCFNPRFCVHKLTQTALILLAVSPTLSGYSWSKQAKPWAEEPHSVATSPEFEATPTSQGFTVHIGQTALLPCVVRNLGDRVVSWIRTRDLHILTTGNHIFTSDNRFELVQKEHIDFWGLKIKKAQLSDSGKYECQVNTDPKMNFAVMLTVTESHMHDSPMVESGWHEGSSVASIQGPREQYVRVGSTITFTCVISRREASAVTHRATPVSRAQLKWTHAGRDVTFQSSRGGISVDTDYRDSQITSRLTIAMVTHEDGGNYTCRDADVKPDTVMLLVVEGEHTEAMQRDRPNCASFRQYSLSPFFIVYFNWVLR